MIRDAVVNDAAQICQIYNYYIKETIITFEIDPISELEMINRMKGTIGQYEWIVWENKDNRIAGYAYYNSFHSRAAYGNSVESTIYVSRDQICKGIGQSLYGELINRFLASKYHAILGGIALPNEASTKLHEKFGFKKVAHFEAVGHKFGKWIDVGYWERIKNV